jgi:hypothetical protein
MKTKLALIVLVVAGLATMAQTCRIRNISLVEIDGDKYYAAEIVNETDADLLAHRFLVAFLNDDLEVIDTKTVEGCLRSLQSDSSDFFSVASDEDPEDIEVAISRVDFNGLRAGQTVGGDLEFSNTEATHNEDDDTLVVTGRIANEDSVDLEDVRVCAVVFDDDGNVVITERSSNMDIDEDDDAGFTLTMNVPDEDDVNLDHVDLWADGLNDGDPTTPVDDADNDIEVCDDPPNTATPNLTQTATATSTATATTTPPTATNTPIPDAC